MILVLGKNGMLGSYVYHYLYLKFYVMYNDPDFVQGTTRENLDVLNIKDLYNNLQDLIKPNSIVINCIGMTNKHDLSDSVVVNNMYLVNSVFPGILYRVCKSKNATLIHPSTDCVFDGKGTGLYKATDQPNATDNYGMSKYLGDQACSQACIIRCSIIGHGTPGINDTGLLDWYLNNHDKDDTCGYDTHYWNGITTLEYAKLLHRIITNKSFWKGVRHFKCDEPAMSKYILLLHIGYVYNVQNKKLGKLSPSSIDRRLEGEEVGTPFLEQLRELREYEFTTV